MWSWLISTSLPVPGTPRTTASRGPQIEIGAWRVPLRTVLNGSRYSPAASVIVVPGCARASAAPMVRSGRAREPASASLPDGATKSVAAPQRDGSSAPPSPGGRQERRAGERGGEGGRQANRAHDGIAAPARGSRRPAAGNLTAVEPVEQPGEDARRAEVADLGAHDLVGDRRHTIQATKRDGGDRPGDGREATRGGARGPPG